MLQSSWNWSTRCILMSSFHYKNKNCKKVKIAKFSIVLHFFYCSLFFKSIEQKKYWLSDFHTYKKVGLGHLEDIKKETIKKNNANWESFFSSLKTLNFCLSFEKQWGSLLFYRSKIRDVIEVHLWVKYLSRSTNTGEIMAWGPTSLVGLIAKSILAGVFIPIAKEHNYLTLFG